MTDATTEEELTESIRASVGEALDGCLSVLARDDLGYEDRAWF